MNIVKRSAETVHDVGQKVLLSDGGTIEPGFGPDAKDAGLFSTPDTDMTVSGHRRQPRDGSLSSELHSILPASR